MRCLRGLACGVAGGRVGGGVGGLGGELGISPNVERTATAESFTYLTMGELTWTCSHVSMTVKPLGQVAATTPGVSNPVNFASCDSFIGTMTVTTLVPGSSLRLALRWST